DNLMNKETKEIQENHGFLGISGADINAQTAETYDMPQGIYISKVAKSLAADKGGLKKGDIITEFDGQPVQSMSQLQELIQYYEVGKTVEVTYYKQSDEGYTKATTEVTLSEYPEAEVQAGSSNNNEQNENSGANGNGGGNSEYYDYFGGLGNIFGF
ncbi:MAG: PDZ domain-containing protein, partial [Lachnospiraceae bacterium]|nr:PDZ domain-containing protein [Lachnospiraceae bacterium]